MVGAGVGKEGGVGEGCVVAVAPDWGAVGVCYGCGEGGAGAGEEGVGADSVVVLDGFGG